MDIDILIGRILQHQATEAETARFEKWLDESEENRKAFKAFKTYWNFPAHKDETRERRRWEQTLGKIYEMDEGKQAADQYLKIHKKREGKSENRFFQWFPQVAAVVVLTLGLGFWFWSQQPLGTPSLDVAKPSITYIEKSTEKGVRKTLKLPDGTRIKLNSRSTLKVPEKFTDSTREVYLKGEAYFDVARDEQRPFIIHTENFDVTVLGTSFNVQAYGEEEKRSVAVVEGKVKVETAQKAAEKKQSLILEKGQMALESGSLQLEKLDENLLSWTSNVLVFDTRDFSQIARQLENWYGVDVKIERMPQMGDGFKGRFKNETLKNVLESMQYTLDIHFNYKQTEQVVVIY